MYDKDNIFAKIACGAVPTNKIYENPYALSFYDVNPMFEKHILIIPRGGYENILDFTTNASAEEQTAFWECFNKTAEKVGIQENFNVLANAGINAPFFKQSVLHFHLHLVAGNKKPQLDKELATI